MFLSKILMQYPNIPMIETRIRVISCIDWFYMRALRANL
jgi:hypothetical protein